MMKNKKLVIVAGLILVAIYFFAGISRFGAFDYDEAVYCAVSREMLTTGNFLVPEYNSRYFLEKPPLFYWLMTLLQKVFRFSDIALAGRLVSILATLGTIFIIYYFTLRLFDNITARFATGVFTFSLGTIITSRAILLDALLNLFLSLTLFIAIAGVTRKYKSAWVISVFAAFATLTKGPVGIILPALIIMIFFLIYRRNFSIKELKLPAGIFLYFLLVLPVFLLLNRATSGQFFRDFFLTHNFARFSEKAFEGHQGPWFYYLVLIFFLLFPASAFLPAAIRHLLSRKSPEKIFFLIWFLVILLVFSVSRTKLPNYIIPAITPLSVILGIYLKELWTKNIPFLWPKTTAAIYILVACLASGLFFLLGPLTNIFRPQLLANSPILLSEIDLSATPTIIGIIFLLGIIFFIFFWAKKLLNHLLISQVALVFLLNLVLINFFVPELYEIFQGDLRQISEEINHRDAGAVLAVEAGLNASLVLYTSKKVFFVSKNESAKIATIKKQFDRLLIVAPKNIAAGLFTRNTRIVKTCGGYLLLLWSI